MITRLFGVEMKDNEMDVGVSSLRNGYEAHGHVEKVIIELKNRKQYILYVKEGVLIKEERNPE